MADFVSVNSDGMETNSANNDKLFDPSVDMLINDFDDERTLEEEEALAAIESEDPNAELSCLQQESDMPLEELLALYGYNEMEENDSPTEDDSEPTEADMIDEPESPEQPSKLNVLYERMPDSKQDASRLLRSVSHISEEEEDYDYSPDEEDWRKVNKTIMVGNDYQAPIPEGLCHYDDALPYENDDKLLWDPNPLDKVVIEDFLKKAALLAKHQIPLGCQIKDDEQALYLLQQCGHNVDEALRRIRINVIPNTESMSLWSEDECKNFESGIRCFGKDFHLIQQNKHKECQHTTV